MTQTIQITMTGQMPNAPYQSVFWTVYGEPDPTGALSGFGANYLINIGVDSITINGASVDPISLTVGGDLFGTLPNPTVVGLQARPIVSTAPTSGQVLAWSGTAWTPTTSPTSSATSAATPNTLCLRDSVGRISLSDNGGTSFATYGQTIEINRTASFAIAQDAQTSNIGTNNISITTQAPFASASGANRLPGNFGVNIPAAVGALATSQSGNFNVNFGGTQYLNLFAIPSATQAYLQFPATNGGQILGCNGISGTNMLITSGTQLTIGSTGIMEMDGNTINIAAAGSCDILGTPLSLSSSGDWNAEADNNMTLDVLGAFTLNCSGGLMSFVNQGPDGILFSDPAGAGITIDCTGGGDLNIAANSGMTIDTPNIALGTGTSDLIMSVRGNPNSGGTGYVLTIEGSNALVGAGIGGLIQINPGLGVGAGANGNVAFFTTPSSAAGAAGGAGTMWIGNRSGAPGTNPVNGIIVYSESGVGKIRSGANTVTLGNKPSVTGSKASGAALASLLTVLATAGLITDNTTA